MDIAKCEILNEIKKKSFQIVIIKQRTNRLIFYFYNYYNKQKNNIIFININLVYNFANIVKINIIFLLLKKQCVSYNFITSHSSPFLRFIYWKFKNFIFNIYTYNYINEVLLVLVYKYHNECASRGSLIPAMISRVVYPPTTILEINRVSRTSSHVNRLTYVRNFCGRAYLPLLRDQHQIYIRRCVRTCVLIVDMYTHTYICTRVT